jgi:hypothetical protein
VLNKSQTTAERIEARKNKQITFNNEVIFKAYNTTRLNDELMDRGKGVLAQIDRHKFKPI